MRKTSRIWGKIQSGGLNEARELCFGFVKKLSFKSCLCPGEEIFSYKKLEETKKAA